MMQAQYAWQTLPGADLVSPEDEPWLKQSEFRFPDDSEEDDTHNVTARAYVQALANLKVLFTSHFALDRTSCDQGAPEYRARP